MYAPKKKPSVSQIKFAKETYIIKSSELGCHNPGGKNGYSRNHAGLFYIRWFYSYKYLSKIFDTIILYLNCY